MEPLIRIDLDKAIHGGAPLILDLGCGRRKKPGRIGIDRVDMPGVDIVADIEEGLGFLPADCVDEIHCRSVLEHVDNFERLLADMVRVLKPQGRARVYVPHFSNPYYYSDYTHKRFFGFYTFYYFVDPSRQPKRKVPAFYSDIRLNIVSIRLVFRSPFPVRRFIRKMLGRFFNCHRSLQEFYEGMCCYLVPCDGIEVVFTPAEPLDAR
jgi:SAM-dependent methyltransferase